MDDQSADSITRAAISEDRSAFVAAISRGDAAAAATAYAVHAHLLPPSADVLRGRPAIVAFWRAGLDAGLLRLDYRPLELTTDDRLAYEVGEYALEMQPPDAAVVVDRGTYVLIHARQADGSWLRTVEMFQPRSPDSKGAYRMHPDRGHLTIPLAAHERGTL